MAYPTKITLTSGKTVYGNGPEDAGNADQDAGIAKGACVASREVRVSVTYRLERSDDDLLAAVERKAKEVEAAHAAVWRQVRKEQAELNLGSESDLGTRHTPHWAPTDGDCPPEEDDPSPPYDAGDDGEIGADDDQIGADDDQIGADDDQISADDDQISADDEPAFGADVDDAPGYAVSANGHGIASHGSSVPSHVSYACRTGSNGLGSNGEDPGNGGSGNDGSGNDGSGARPVPATKPQKLALSAQARRLGLSDVALAEIIGERFGKSSFTPRFAVDRLTKVEAGDLLRALSEREWEAARQSRSVPA